ncbi:MAG: hypothetical protein ACFFBD_18055 [Candidatus Hodarchaeota archaeon]
MTVSLVSFLTLLLRLAAVFISVLLMYTLVLRWRQTRIKAILLLLPAIFMSFLLDIVNLWEAIVYLDSLIPLSILTFSRESTILSLLGLNSAGCFLLFIDYFERDHISAIRLSLFVGMSAAYITGLLISLTSQVSGINLGMILVFLLVPVFLAIVAVIGIKAFQNMKRFAFDNEHKNQLLFMQLVFFSYFFLTSFFIFLSGSIIARENLPGEIKQLIWFFPQELSLLAASVLLWHVYARSSRIAFLQPQRIYKLLILNRSGLPLYIYEFIRTETSVEQDYLVSGGITATKSLLKDAIGATSEIHSISFEDKEVMLTNREKFVVVLFVERKSNYLKIASEMFSVKFEEKYGDNISDHVNKALFEGTDHLIERAFGLAREKVSLLPWK